jgi:hypothetical protein
MSGTGSHRPLLDPRHDPELRAGDLERAKAVLASGNGEDAEAETATA